MLMILKAIDIVVLRAEKFKINKLRGKQ